MKKVSVFFADGFEEVEGLTIVDLLRRADIDVTMVSANGNTEINGAHKIVVKTDAQFDDVNYDEMDLLVLPGGLQGVLNLQKHEGLLKLLQKFDAEKKMIGAICAGPIILGELGMLKGRAAVCYPDDGLRAKLLGAEVKDERAVVSGHIITGRGVGAAIVFSLTLIELLLDAEKAKEVKAAIVYGH